MFLEHFGLREPPFRLTPDTGRFFAGANRGRMLEALIHAILHGEGIVRVTGEVGSGKTMLMRMLLERLPAEVETACLAHPALSREEMLFALSEELGVSVASERPGALLQALQQRLIDLHAVGRRAVVLIDEAHAMPAATLEEIRLLSNLETRDAKLLQIVLFGQPELDDMLESARMRQLRDRITHHFRIEPLRREDVAAYVAFRLRAAGCANERLFSKAALRRIAAASGGLTRRVNVLADKALLAAFAAGEREVGAAHVRLAVRDSGLEHAARWQWVLAAVAAVGVLAGAAAVLYRNGPDPQASERIAPAAPLRSGPPATPMSTGLPAAPAAGGGAPQAARPIAESGSTARVEPLPAAQPVTAKTPGPRTDALLARTRDRLAASPTDRWVIQLLSAPAENAAELDRFIADAARLASEDALGIYPSEVGGVPRLAVIYGDYPDLAAASVALAQLPPELRANGAFPREIRRPGRSREDTAK